MIKDGSFCCITSTHRKSLVDGHHCLLCFAVAVRLDVADVDALVFWERLKEAWRVLTGAPQVLQYALQCCDCKA